jgi:hypothetical protein
MKDNASQFTEFGFDDGDPDEGLSFDAYLITAYIPSSQSWGVESVRKI